MHASLLQWVLLGLAATAASASPAVKRDAPLDSSFKARGKKFWGSAADINTLGISQVSSILASEFGAVTPEYSMKWDQTEPSRGAFNFGDSDQLVKWATDNNKQIRGHTLLWYMALPGWVSAITDGGELTSVIQNHIANVAGHFAGKLYAWDVVNEIFNDDGSYRNSVFYNVLGEDFVRIAFQAAKNADPNAKLYINDYGLDNDNSKIRALVALVQRINSAGHLIDGIGSQSHLPAGQTNGQVGIALDILSGAGVEVAITELDIEGAADADYQAVVQDCLNHPSCVSISTWGVSDASSWKAQTTPLLWDSNYNAKQAKYGVVGRLQSA